MQNLPGSIETVIRSINDEGETTGLYRTPDDIGHGFVYSNEQFSSFDVPGANFTTGVRINDRGDIVGFIRRASDGKSVSFLRR
jgi:hypothetical protein